MRVNQLGSVDADDREVRFRVLANHGGPKCAAVSSSNFQSACAVNDMAVREHVPVGRDYKTRPRAAGFRSALPSVVGMMHADVYDGWANLLDDATDSPRIGVEQFLIVLCEWLDRWFLDNGIRTAKCANEFLRPTFLKCGKDFHLVIIGSDFYKNFFLWGVHLLEFRIGSCFDCSRFRPARRVSPAWKLSIVW